jgi:hypothetical protein
LYTDKPPGSQVGCVLRLDAWPDETLAERSLPWR